MSLQRLPLESPIEIPQPDRAVLTRRSDLISVGREGDRENQSVVSHQGLTLSCPLKVPKPDGAVRAC